MRKISLYLFLFTYTTVMFKPVIPFVTDCIAHLLFYKDHILTVHAHYGKFHVHAAIAEEAKNDQSEKNTNNLKKENQINEHIIYEACRVPALKVPLKYYNFQSVHSMNMSIVHDYPPPRA